MLIDFSVTNFTSFKEKNTISMEKSTIQKHPEHIVENKLLSGLVIYGANASGKSNLLQAIGVLGQLTLPQSVLGLKNTNSFMLGDNTPTEFEINFISSGVKYNYKIMISSTEIMHEELSFVEKNFPSLVYKRNGVNKIFGELFQDDWYKNRSFPKDVTLLSKLLSDGIVDNHVPHKQHILNVVDFLRGIVYFETRTEVNPAIIYNNFKFAEFKSFLLDLLKQADSGITDITFKPIDRPTTMALTQSDIANLANNPEMVLCSQQNTDYYFFSMPKGKLECKLLVVHHNDIDFNMGRESAGTIKLFKLGFILHYYKNIKGSKILLLDDFDSLFHPFLAKIILKSLLQHPLGGQIITVLHNTLLLAHDIWRVDEIWFAQKSEDGASRLYPLTDINPRFDKKLEKDYINGRYGAIPFLGGEQAWLNIIK